MNTPQAEQLGREIVALRPRQLGAVPLIGPILSALQVRRIVNEGGEAVGRSDKMPSWRGTFSQQEIESIILYVFVLRENQ